MEAWDDLVHISRQDFEAYQQVLESEVYNMLSEGARRATGLSEEKYYAILNYYSVYKRMYDNNELIYE